jgi:hypothetical protein
MKLLCVGICEDWDVVVLFYCARKDAGDNCWSNRMRLADRSEASRIKMLQR